jgi:hypothetical protein
MCVRLRYLDASKLAYTRCSVLEAIIMGTVDSPELATGVPQATSAIYYIMQSVQGEV